MHEKIVKTVPKAPIRPGRALMLDANLAVRVALLLGAVMGKLGFRFNNDMDCMLVSSRQKKNSLQLQELCHAMMADCRSKILRPVNEALAGSLNFQTFLHGKEGTGRLVSVRLLFLDVLI